jgi:hypothetical protein
MPTIQEIQAMPIHGNHFHDSGLFKTCETFIRGDSLMPEKIAALNKVLEAMGEPQAADEAQVNEYLSYC